MEIITDPHEMQALALGWRRQAKSVALVPTMGALHRGHLELARVARGGCDQVVASVFVNPTQFGPGEDLARYPRPFEHDHALLRSEGVDVLFAPSARTMYGVESLQEWLSRPHASVEVAGLGEMWEGEARPGHMRGVATVVAKLFNACLPTQAYFGEKDFQQLRVIERMVADLFFALAIVPVPTVREDDGLARSSRNAYLAPHERAAAPILSQALRTGAAMARAGERQAQVLEHAMRAVIAGEPTVKVQYLAVVDSSSLEQLQVLEAPGLARVLVAARLGATRLIDNAAI